MTVGEEVGRVEGEEMRGGEEGLVQMEDGVELMIIRNKVVLEVVVEVLLLLHLRVEDSKTGVTI